MLQQIDQRLNASFGQTNSSQQHVYNISLCKGIPFYGFHSNEHQYFRIELYNPNLIKRTAGLLLSGNILGKMFQPHESHIPYILRFFIDFNLFGMSYLHVPMRKVHTRSMYGDSKHKKRSVSHLEVDFSAVYIINRAELIESNDLEKGAANKGIESIWEDERRRRQNASQDLPELKPIEEEINVCGATNSDIFFQKALKERYLGTSSKTMDDTLTSSIRETSSMSVEKASKRTYDLKTYLDTSAYATEFSQSSSSSKEMDVTLSLDVSQSIEELENHFLESQKSDTPLQEDDDFDSLLSPFTQMDPIRSTQKSCDSDKSTQHVNMFQDEFDDEEREFNMTLADLEAAVLHDDEEKDFLIPQLDGLDNDQKLKDDSQPGPSGISIKKEQVSFKSENSSIDFRENFQDLLQHFYKNSKIKQEAKDVIFSSDNSSDDERMKSFYDQTLFTNDFEDDLESGDSSGCSIKKEFEEHDKSCIITLANEPPDPSFVFATLNDYNIPMANNKSAFYSNPMDVTEKKEVGYNILEIKSNKLNDCEPFKSVIYDRSQIEDERLRRLSLSLGFLPKSAANFHQLIDNNSDVIIHPISIPPTYSDAKKWLQTPVEKSSSEERKPATLEDSPVKVKRSKILMVMDETLLGQNDDLDATLVPQTPETKVSVNTKVIQSSLEKDTESLSEYIEEGIYLSYSARKKRKKKAKNSFSKRFQEIMKAKVTSTANFENSISESSQSSLNDNEKMSDSSEDILRESQSIKLSNDTYSPSIIQDANVPLSDSYESSTLNNTFGFKMKLESLHSNDEHTDLTILSMELHVQTKDDFNPNPETDEISAIFYRIEGFYVNEQPTSSEGMIIVCEEKENLGYFKDDIDIYKAKNELDLLDEFFRKIRLYDPDIFAGYEIELQSWGYLFERGFVLNMNLCNALSRMPLEKEKKAKIMQEEEHDRDQGDYYSEQKIPGRILLDVWRLMRHEIALTSYTFENIAYHILHRR